MKYPNIILPLCLLTKDCINFLKLEKHYHVGRQLHGAKKTLINYLYEHYPHHSVQKVLQLNEGGRHCMVKFSFIVSNQVISFHLPEDRITWNYTVTNPNVKVLIGKIPPDGNPSFCTEEEVKMLTNMLNSIPKLRDTDKERLKKTVTRFEDYIYVLAPKRYA